MVKTEHVAQTETIEVTQQTVKRRLDKLRKKGEVGGLQIGRGWVWWIPEKDSELEIDSSTIHWDGIKPEQIPVGLIEQHPEYPDPGPWEKLRDQGETLANTSVYPIIVGLGVLLVGEFGLEYIPLPSNAQAVGAVAFVGGFAFFVFGLLMIVIANLGYRVDNRGIAERLSNTRLRDFI